MALYRMFRGHALVLSSMLCLGCAGGSPRPQRNSGEVLAILPPSEEDTANRYSSVVALTRTEQERPYCSGVLIAPQVVLTAAHCVCKDVLSTDGDTKILDPSTCKKQASISTALYRQTSPRKGDILKRYSGEVLAHPELVEAQAVGQERLLRVLRQGLVHRPLGRVQRHHEQAEMHGGVSSPRGGGAD